MDCNEQSTRPEWGAGLAELIVACPLAAPSDQVALLRQGYAAIAAAGTFDPELRKGLSRQTKFDALLACGAPESAAFLLVPDEAGLMLSRGNAGVHIASICMPQCGEHTAEASTVALAMMGAILSACRAIVDLQGMRPALLH